MGAELTKCEGIVAGGVGGDAQSLADDGNSAGLLTRSEGVPMREFRISLNQHRDHQEVTGNHLLVLIAQGLELRPYGDVKVLSKDFVWNQREIKLRTIIFALFTIITPRC